MNKGLEIPRVYYGVRRLGSDDKVGKVLVCYHESEKLPIWKWSGTLPEPDVVKLT